MLKDYKRIVLSFDTGTYLVGSQSFLLFISFITVTYSGKFVDTTSLYKAKWMTIQRYVYSATHVDIKVLFKTC